MSKKVTITIFIEADEYDQIGRITDAVSKALKTQAQKEINDEKWYKGYSNLNYVLN